MGAQTFFLVFILVCSGAHAHRDHQLIENTDNGHLESWLDRFFEFPLKHMICDDSVDTSELEKHNLLYFRTIDSLERISHLLEHQVSGAERDRLSVKFEGARKLAVKYKSELAEQRSCFFRKKTRSIFTTDKKLYQRLLKPDAPQDSKLFLDIFRKLSGTDELDENSCNLLRTTHQVWASRYPKENLTPQKNIPIYNVNVHNASFIYWLETSLRKDFPLDGIPLVHVDTHTDMGHIDEHLMDERFRKIPFTELKGLLGRNPPNKLALMKAARRSVSEITQPVTAAFVTNPNNGHLSNELLSIGGAWVTRVGKSKTVDPLSGKILPSLVNLSKLPRRGFVWSFEKPDEVIVRPGTPFLEQKVPMEVFRKNIPFRRAGIIRESQEKIITKDLKELHDYAMYLPESTKKTGFILDIDLDAFASEGAPENHGRPISFARTSKKDKVEVSSEERNRIRQRLDAFFDRLRRAKEKGYLPKVITIADSTHLMAAYGDLEDQTNTGENSLNNFTPSCLVFLLNYEVKSRLKALYKI